MKIAFLSRTQKTAQRGAENFVYELSSRFSKSMSVDILSGKDADSIPKILAGHYDVVIPINGRMQALKASLLRLLGGYKVLITGHSGIGRDDIWNIVIGKPNIFIALTTKAENWAKSFAWNSKVLKIPNGIDLDKFNPKGEKFNIELKPPIILSVGALTWYKHHERVIEAVSRLDSVSLLIVGKGEQEKKLTQLAEKKLSGRYKIISADYQKLPSIYRSCNLFTLPSWDREAFGIVYLEAMATNLAVVAPDDSSRREIIQDAGEFVDTNNPDEYAKSLKKALETNWSNKPRKQAERFSWNEIANKYQKVLADLVKN